MTLYFVWGGIFIMLLKGVYESVSYIREVSLLSVMGHTVMRKMSESERERLEKEKRQRMIFGNRRKMSRIHRIDMLLLRSGIRNLLPYFNTEMFLLMLLGGVIAAEAAGVFRRASFLWFIFSPAAVVGGCYILLRLMADRNYKRAEEQLLPFMNLIGNYSHTEDDLIHIFGRIVPYLEQPYKDAVEECHLYARATGDAVSAYRELGMKIPHEQFQRLMRNLEICCQHDANYAEIIDDSREMLQDYLKNKKERESVKKNARIEILLLVSGCLLVLWMMNGLMAQGIWELLKSTLPGKIMLVYCGGVLAACVKLFFSVN